MLQTPSRPAPKPPIQEPPSVPMRIDILDFNLIKKFLIQSVNRSVESIESIVRSKKHIDELKK